MSRNGRMRDQRFLVAGKGVNIHQERRDTMSLSMPDQRMAWRGADLRKDDIAFDLTRQHAAALEELLDRFCKQGLGLGQILPDHCRHPALDEA